MTEADEYSPGRIYATAAYSSLDGAQREIERLMFEIAKLTSRAERAEAEVERLREALRAAESWIVDGGHCDHRDAYLAESANDIVREIRAALAKLEGKP